MITSPVEHPAVRGAARALAELGFAVEDARVDREGRLDLDDVAARCAGGGAVLAIAAVNHELGTVQDVAGVAAIARAAGIAVHVDAVQVAGRMPLGPLAAVADALALSGHKIGAPKGTGALWVRRGVDVASVVAGGHQERGRRPGTENVAGIAGLGAAAAAVRLDRWADVVALAARLEAGLVALGARIHGAGAPRVGNTVNAAFPGARGDDVVIALDLAGVACSTGAACSSGSVEPSPVVLALGLPAEEAREAIRFSLGAGNSADDVDRVLALLPPIVSRARRARRPRT